MMKKCVVCHKAFTPYSYRHIICTKACREIKYKSQVIPYVRKPVFPRQCVGCKMLFPASAKSSKKYCTEQCRINNQEFNFNLRTRFLVLQKFKMISIIKK